MERLDSIHGNSEQETADDRIREYQFWEFFTKYHDRNNQPEQDTMTIHGGWYAVAGVTLAAFLWWVLNTGGYLG